MQVKKSNKILFFCLLVLSIFTMIRLVDSVDYWIVDIFSHFSVQYALMALLLLVAFLWKRTLSLALAAGLLFILNISVLANLAASA